MPPQDCLLVAVLTDPLRARVGGGPRAYPAVCHHDLVLSILSSLYSTFATLLVSFATLVAMGTKVPGCWDGSSLRICGPVDLCTGHGVTPFP